MKAQLKSIGLLTAVLLATDLAAQDNKQPAPADNAPKITYIANEGFLLEHGGGKVLTDALFDTGSGPFLAPSQELLAQLTEARGPFANVDLLLVTHPHADHFNPKLVAAYLRNNTRRQLIAHTQAVDHLRKEEGFVQIQDQIHEVNLEPGARQRLTVKGIVIDALCLAHKPYYVDGRNAHERVRNLAFVVDLGGTRFLHLGDATVESSLAHLNAYPFDETPVDLLFVAYLDRSQATQQFIARKIKPSRIIAMHVPPAELAEESKRMGAAYPYAIVFKQSMERRSTPIEVDFHNLSGAYFGQPPPGATPEVFARGIVSTDDLEHSAPCFSPDGNEVYWRENRRPGPDNKEGRGFNMTMRRENGRWSAPYVAPNGLFVFSADGRRAYFSSARPRSGAAQQGQPDLDIWFVERNGDNWGEPKCLNLVARYPELRWAGVHAIARNGALCFMGYTPGPLNDFGIYRAELINGEYARPQLLPRSINLPPFLNWTPFIAPDENYLLFSSNRTGSPDDAGDLYISRRLADGSWTEPVSLGAPVNSRQQERLPMLSLDGKYLFFTRPTPGHDQDVYWVDAATIPALRSIANLPQENPK